MEPKYIQLPPLPSDMPVEALETIWLYTQLSRQEQRAVRDFLRENLKEDNKDLDETELAKMMQEPETEVNPDVKEYSDLMRKLLGTLIAQSCEMAALVYQDYCIEKKSVEEISKVVNLTGNGFTAFLFCRNKKKNLTAANVAAEKMCGNGKRETERASIVHGSRFCIRTILHPGQILVGECLPQTQL